MAIDKIAVLRVSGDSLARFAPAEEGALEGFTALAGEGGGPFAVRAVEGGVLVVPFASFEDPDALALHLRLLLGAVLDAHDDARGIRVISHEAAAAGKGYDDLVAGEAGAWIHKVAADDERLPRNAGWSFADAARAFSTPGTRKRADAESKEGEKAEGEKAESAEGDDPLEKAEGKFGQIFSAREGRGALRRTLSAAVEHSLEASALGALVSAGPSESDLNKEERALAEPLRRGLTSNPDVMTALETTLRKAVDEELKDVITGSAKDAAPEEPKEEPR
ncbi:hypothetical protein [Polyangium sp. y55x31]|uniref:hypothetical protein n=1 Tax=Polyangium sp. y55x31 TaxID=3042688 RepID=UPI00248248AD|nr:hypothetical protein [Polyangium sp. y55x31]MDI1479852.1 hypothetical protein [Polyangium sp. y55x31]